MSDHPTLTLELVRPVAEEIVGAQPDYVYARNTTRDIDGPRCNYERGGKPSCVVGQILHELGWKIHELENFDGKNGYAGGTIGRLIDRGQVQVDNEATRMFLSVLQSRQDQGTPWGKALEAAERYAAVKAAELQSA